MAHRQAQGEVCELCLTLSLSKDGGEAAFYHYLAEFDFCYNERKIPYQERVERLLVAIQRRRLTYRHSLAALF